MDKKLSNTLINEEYYDSVYINYNVDDTIQILHNVDVFLNNAKQVHTSWVGLYHNDFDKTLKGKKVLELGCGDCLNAAVMSVLGAEVYGNDLSQHCGTIINNINSRFDFETPIKFIQGDFLQADIPSDFFDIVVGKAFVHHLTYDEEVEFTEKIVRILKKDGVVRYCEPAINSVIFDKLRFMIPLKDRPSSFQKEKFKEWKALDPHPERDNSSSGYRKMGNKYFSTTEIYCIGCIEKFHRLLPSKVNSKKFRRMAFQIERYLPLFIRNIFARAQMVEYRFPKK
jgi:SAM-dependent methyltransferase